MRAVSADEVDRESVRQRAAAVIARREAGVATAAPDNGPYRRQSLDQMMNFGVRGERHYVTRRQEVIAVEDGSLIVEPDGNGGDCDTCNNCSRGPTCGRRGGCGGCGGHGCMACCGLGCLASDRWELFAGVQGFTGPLNHGGTGSFGFHEGINKACALGFCDSGLGLQLGVRATQANFSGVEFADGANTFQLDDSRQQIFVTGGLFRRVDWGLQGGVVVDYLHDAWFQDVDLWQLRSELSWVYPCNHEVGFFCHVGLSSDTFHESIVPVGQATAVAVSGNANPTDVYGLFYRYRFDNTWNSDGRVFAGVSDNSDGLLGIDFRLPLSDKCAIAAGFTYLLPQESAGQGGQQEEAWNVGISLVWQPWGCRSGDSHYYRALFDVADNGSFLVDRR